MKTKIEITKRSYELQKLPPGLHYCIKILDKPYTGIVVGYTDTRIVPPAWGNDFFVDYNFHILECPLHIKREEVWISPHFREYVKKLLSHAMESAFNSGKYSITPLINREPDKR